MKADIKQNNCLNPPTELWRAVLVISVIVVVSREVAALSLPQLMKTITKTAVGLFITVFNVVSTPLPL